MIHAPVEQDTRFSVSAFWVFILSTLNQYVNVNILSLQKNANINDIRAKECRSQVWTSASTNRQHDFTDALELPVFSNTTDVEVGH